MSSAQLTTEIGGRTVQLRPPATVMSSADMLTARSTRHSFSRSMLRRAISHNWQVTREIFDIDANGVGTVIYRIDAEGQTFRWVGFSTDIPDEDRTDRVIAKHWDITTCLVEGDVDAQRLENLRSQVPLQEKGRADKGSLIWARANKSMRFFNYVADCLASGNQPDRDYFGNSPYIVRSTAFYSNGRFNLVPFESFPANHPLQVPYRPHMLSAWMLREFSIDLVEHVAKAKNPDAAELTEDWRRYLGVGNATGLGLVPYALNHPLIMEAWAKAREFSLASALSRTVDFSNENDRANVALVSDLMDKAIAYFTERDITPGDPFPTDASIVACLTSVREHFSKQIEIGGEGDVALWSDLYHYASNLDAECASLVASLITEITDDIDNLLRVDEIFCLEPTMTVAKTRQLIAEHYQWVLDIDFDDPRNTEYMWYLSKTNEEPRRIKRVEVNKPESELQIGIARRVFELDQLLAQTDDDETIAQFLLNNPDQRYWVARVQLMSKTVYGEARHNALNGDFLPLSLQRFQLAMYGMSNYNPKSTDWLRVTLMTGMPSVRDVSDESESNWLFVGPPR
ncbi:MAG: hypothetical protein Q4P05_00665 [Actinomycetaceae bacterium]|nr:hypothetical protein [Actinomycetaceae bacterium]